VTSSSPRRTVLRTVLVAVCIAAVSVIAPGPASAQANPGAGGPEVDSWALAPAGTNPDEPSSRPFLSYDLAPGASVDDTVTLWNYSNVQLTFRVYATDAFNNEAGDFDLLTGDKTAKDLGSWVHLTKEYVTVPASTRIDIPFTLAVPPDARSGDHAAAIVASSQVTGTDEKGQVVPLDRRTGSRVYLHVAGQDAPELNVESVYSVYHAAANPFGGSLDVTWTVRNSGNLRLGGKQELLLHKPLGGVMQRRQVHDLPELLPGNAVTLHVHFDDVTAAFRVSAEVKVTPSSANDAKLAVHPASRTSATWAIPWTAILLVILLYLAWRRLRRRRAARPPTPPNGSGGGGPDRIQVLVRRT
jgi:hypothetical protein